MPLDGRNASYSQMQNRELTREKLKRLRQKATQFLAIIT